MKRILLLGVLCFSALVMMGQSQEPAPTFKDRLFFTGEMGFAFGDYTRITLAPIVGVEISPRVSAGIGFEYQYSKDKRYSPSQTFHDYGGRLFSRFFVVPTIYAHAEFAGFNYEIYQGPSLETTREFVPFLFLGAGYRQHISSRTFFTAQVLFDVLQDNNSPYKAGEPFFSIGVGVGLGGKP